MHFKAPDNSVHFIEPEFAHLLPSGSVSITPEEAEALRPKPDAHFVIEAKKQMVRAARKDILDILVGITTAAFLTNDTDTTAAYLVVRQGLLNITDDWPADPTLVDDLVMQRYLNLRAQCTPQMVSAFAQVAS